ncbi:hypothetical protein ACMD2_10633 [Ananas comosus]|uniref:Uncharacterized protein n=1 Tax=Ananas comosus TaxID=4615 RepID=A0A199USR1_ANACO|nr:hypothetical protein ACMD2_10633 [Ananas comosus]
MGPGEEVKTRPEPNVEILEKGEIFFFYRPKVNKEEAQGPDDVQRIYIVLRPQSGKQPVEEKQASESGKEGRKKGRSIKEGSGKQPVEEKQASEPGKEGRKKGQSKEASKQRHRRRRPRTERNTIRDAGRATDRLRGRWRRACIASYATSRRGGRVGRSTPTSSTSSIPPSGSEGEPQESFNVEREASFLIQVKNPEVGRGDGSDIGGGFRGLQTKRRRIPGAPARAVRGEALHTRRPTGLLKLRGLRAFTDISVGRYRRGVGIGAEDGVRG